MKKFFTDYSFYAVKMFVYQFAISLFGLTLSMAFSRLGSITWQLITSIGSVLFYLFLLYYMTWQLGYSDRVAAGHGRLVPKPLTGLYVSILANSINFIFAILVLCGVGLGAFSIIFEGMYAGIMLAVRNGADAIPVWMYFVIILPALFTCTLSYYLGLKDKSCTTLFNPQKPKKKKEKDSK